MKDPAASDSESGDTLNTQMGKICIELLTKAALCAATVGLIASAAAAVFFRS